MGSDQSEAPIYKACNPHVYEAYRPYMVYVPDLDHYCVHFRWIKFKFESNFFTMISFTNELID